MRYRDLPPARPDVRRPDGSILLSQQPFLYCSVCGGRYSADRGDYFMVDQATEIRCCGRLMRLVIERVEYVDVPITAATPPA
jgi:DNA replicative helicase MCM subunit Mcm2 (Cdc46/Mcm family)